MSVDMLPIAHTRFPQAVLHVLSAFEGHAFGTVKAAEDGHDRLATRKQIDRQSDDYLCAALLACGALIRDEPRVAYRVRAIRELVMRGLVYDAMEDEHCDAADADLLACADEGRAVASLVERSIKCLVCGIRADQCRCGDPENAA